MRNLVFCISKNKRYTSLLAKKREHRGAVCPKCGFTRHYRLKNRLRYHCAHCGSRRSLRSGTAV